MPLRLEMRLARAAFCVVGSYIFFFLYVFLYLRSAGPAVAPDAKAEQEPLAASEHGGPPPVEAVQPEQDCPALVDVVREQVRRWDDAAWAELQALWDDEEAGSAAEPAAPDAPAPPCTAKPRNPREVGMLKAGESVRQFTVFSGQLQSHHHGLRHVLASGRCTTPPSYGPRD